MQPTNRVTIEIEINCGCGFRPKSAEPVSEAKEHAEKTGHLMTLQGLIGPTKKIYGGRLLK